MEFHSYTVGPAGPLKFSGGTRVALTDDQYRRRAHNLIDVEHDGERHIATVDVSIMFKHGETFELGGALPKSYYALVLNPPVDKPAPTPATAPAKKRKAKK